jgi:hypothetical protein
MTVEKAEARHAIDAEVIRGGSLDEGTEAVGKFMFECCGPDGRVKWCDEIDNVVCTVGKNLALDTYLAGAAYTVVGPFMGLISSVGYGAGPVAGDTMTSHAGWTEAGGANVPTYSAPRKTCVWAASSGGAKALSAALSFAVTGAGTFKGAFIVFGSGAVSTIDSTAGVLYSAGTFAQGDKVVGNGDTLNVSYTASM